MGYSGAQAVVAYIEPLPMATVDLGPVIVVVLVVAIFAWCFLGGLVLYRALYDMMEYDPLCYP